MKVFVSLVIVLSLVYLASGGLFSGDESEHEGIMSHFVLIDQLRKSVSMIVDDDLSAASLWGKLGFAYQQAHDQWNLGTLSEALECYDKAYDISMAANATAKDMFQWSVTRGSVMLQMGRAFDALRLFNATANALPITRTQYHTITLHKADAYSLLGRYEQAVETYRIAVQQQRRSGLFSNTTLISHAYAGYMTALKHSHNCSYERRSLARNAKCYQVLYYTVCTVRISICNCTILYCTIFFSCHYSKKM